ncbi:MAG: putative LPS assembly protein LptD, partial [Gemmatimonadota bacterium]
MTRCGWGWVVGMAWMLVLPLGVRAQQQEPPVDSTRLRIMDRLKLLGRGPGADSALFVQDSIAREEARNRRPSTAQAPDSTLRALLAMPGFSVTEYDGAEADFSAKDRVLVLRAGEDKPAEVSREGIQVEADTSITYSEQSGQVRTVGNSTFTPPEGEPMESQGLVYDLRGGLGAARGAKTSYQQGQGTWYVRGDMPLATQDSSFMDHATFTSCDLTVPHYHFETDEIKIVGGKILVARPVKLYFADVPVAWLPFMATSLARGRSSGLLTPAFSVNDIVRNSTGYRRRISNLGFYWAMSDYSDAVVALDWFSDNFLALTSSVRYRWNRQFLNGTVNLRQFWRQNGTKELALDTRHSWEMDERTSLRVSGRFVTSTDLITENSFNPAEVTQSITSEGGINRRFDWGTMSVSANRNEYLSDNRVAWTLPSVNLNLSTITLFRAPESRARFYNNMTWSGRAAFNRQTLSREQADTFKIGQADTENRKASVSSNLSIGNLTFSQSLDLDQASALGVPDAYFVQAEGDSAGAVLTGGPARSITDQNLSWSLSLGYLQHLIGSTTITPNVSMSGKAFQSDTSSLASSFISQPSRVSVGATLKTDIYGFFPGFGPYQRIRH